MTMLSSSQWQVLLGNPWFSGLPEDLREELVEAGTLMPLATGQHLFLRGTRGDAIYALLEGCVQLSGVAADGQQAVLDLYGPGIWIGEISALDGNARTHDAQAIANTLVLRVGQLELEALLDRHPVLCRAFLHLAHQRLRQVLEGLEAFALQTLERRLAGRLLLLAKDNAATPDSEADLRLSQEFFAQLMGASRQRVNQLLKSWQSDGLIELRYGRLRLLDRRRMEALAWG